MMTPANYAAIHPRRRGIYVSIAWRRSRVNTPLKRQQLKNRRTKNDYYNCNHNSFYTVPAFVSRVDGCTGEGRMKSNDQIILDALKREHKRLSLKAQKAKELYDKYMEAPLKKLDLYKEALEFSKRTDISNKCKLKKINELAAQEKELNKLMQLDFMKLSNEVYKHDNEIHALVCEIQSREFIFKKHI